MLSQYFSSLSLNSSDNLPGGVECNKSLLNISQKPQVQADFSSQPLETSKHYITTDVIRRAEGSIKCLIYSQSDILFSANR